MLVTHRIPFVYIECHACKYVKVSCMEKGLARCLHPDFGGYEFLLGIEKDCHYFRDKNKLPRWQIFLIWLIPILLIMGAALLANSGCTQSLPTVEEATPEDSRRMRYDMMDSYTFCSDGYVFLAIDGGHRFGLTQIFDENGPVECQP